MSEPQATQWRIPTWFPDFDPKLQEKLKIYHDELQKFNRTLNLVSTKTLPFTDAIHFADSLLASRMIFQDLKNVNEIYDLGSGNGFPGLVFATLFPNIQVILVDSDQRKCEFLKHIASALSLSNVTIRNCTIESLPPNSIKVCMARGLASISKAILITRKCVPMGGIFYHLKSENWSAEVGEIPTQLCSVWTPALVGDYKLPIGPMKLAIVKTTKIA